MTTTQMASAPLTQAHLKTPKAAAIAGMLFSVLLIAVFWLLRASIPADPQEPGSWLRSDSSSVALALNLMPFAGIAFLWFIGVLRDRLGELEDRFFATVFFGSGLLFLATLFTAAAIVGAILIAFQQVAETKPNLDEQMMTNKPKVAPRGGVNGPKPIRLAPYDPDSQCPSCVQYDSSEST
jgi:hypothetical protein